MDPVVYHGGPVMHSVASHAIFWTPAGFAFAAGFQSVVEKYFTAIAHASGSTSDVYSVARQYFDTTGAIANQLSFAGSIIATDPLPPSACSDPAILGPCLSVDELQAEVERVVDAHGLPHGLSDMYFLFTPTGIGSCAGASCYGYVGGYCAYHTQTTPVQTSTIIWANMPFGAARGCNLFNQQPNGSQADFVLDGVSHEQIEAMTDPLGTGWFGNAGGADEVGDKCYRSIPPMIGGSLGRQYDQLIDGVGFDLQPEWSNAAGGCAMTLSHAPPWPSFTVSGAAPAGSAVNFDASSSMAQDGVPITSYAWEFGDGTASQGSIVSHTYQVSGQHEVTLTVTDASGAQNSYSAPFPPTAFQPVSAVRPNR